MFIERRSITPQEQKRIATICTVVLIIIFGVLLLAFWSIQILKGKDFAERAQKNIHDILVLKAPRGIITDRFGHIIASNRLHFSLFFKDEQRENISDISQSHLLQIGISQSELKSLVTYFSDKKTRGLVPIRRNLSTKSVIYIESRPELQPFFQIEIEPARAYPFGTSGSHVLGFMGEISANELERLKELDYSMGDVIGKSGLEKQYENFLRGVKGKRYVIKDNLGTIHGITKITPPEIGATLVTTLDFPVQEQIEQIFSDQIGTIAVADLRDGGLLALVSKPNFDPDILSGIITSQFWESTLNDPSRPLQNRFSQGQYSPGSVFKLVVALAGISEHVVNPETMVMCTGSIQIYDRPFRCWQAGGHGPVNLADAIKGSCNVYFYQLGKKLDVDQIARYANQLGLGRLTGIDLPNEKEGIIPTKKWKEKKKKQPWFPGETISVAIGGGWVSVTPAQILQMVSTIALRGRSPNLHLVKRIEKDKRSLYQYTPSHQTCTIENAVFESVIEGMWRAVNKEGTARRTAIPGYDICGKTGTQQIISKENPNYSVLTQQTRFRPHAWFASFAPRERPRYAVVIMVENGGDAGLIAVPLAEKVYQLLRNREQNV